MGIIKNRTTIDNRTIISLVANDAVGKFTEKTNAFENKFEKEMTR